MFDFCFVGYLVMFDFWFFGYLARNVNAALVTGLLAAAACPDQLRKEAAGRWWVVGAPWLEKQTNKQNVSSFLPRLFRLYKLIWEQLNWPFPASAHIVYGIYIYVFKISQIKIADTYICLVCWPTTEWQIDKVANTSAGHMGISRAGGSDLWGLTCEFLESWTFWCFCIGFYWGWTIFFQSHLKDSSIPNKWFEKIWTNCARWIKWSGAKLCVDKIQTAINHL